MTKFYQASFILSAIVLRLVMDLWVFPFVFYKQGYNSDTSVVFSCSSFDTILLLDDPKHEKGKERLKSKTSENLVGQEIQLETYHLKGIKCHQ